MTAPATTIEEDLADADARTRITEDTTAIPVQKPVPAAEKPTRWCNGSVISYSPTASSLIGSPRSRSPRRRQPNCVSVGPCRTRRTRLARVGKGSATTRYRSHWYPAASPPASSAKIHSKLGFHHASRSSTPWVSVTVVPASLATDAATALHRRGARRRAEAMHILIATGVSVNQIRTLADGLDRNLGPARPERASCRISRTPISESSCGRPNHLRLPHRLPRRNRQPGPSGCTCCKNC